MNVTQAIYHVAQRYQRGDKPSHCDVRCQINDLVADNERISRNGYDQDRAFMRVRRALGTPVTRDQLPYKPYKPRQ